jgi:hypothetical protein
MILRVRSWHISWLISCISGGRHAFIASLHSLILSGVTLSAATLTNGTSP